MKLLTVVNLIATNFLAVTGIVRLFLEENDSTALLLFGTEIICLFIGMIFSKFQFHVRFPNRFDSKKDLDIWAIQEKHFSLKDVKEHTKKQLQKNKVTYNLYAALIIFMACVVLCLDCLCTFEPLRSYLLTVSVGITILYSLTCMGNIFIHFLKDDIIFCKDKLKAIMELETGTTKK